MSKPVLNVGVTSLRGGGRSVNLPGLFDTGAFITAIRADCLPPGTKILPFKKTKVFRTATKSGRLHAIGTTDLTFTIGKKKIFDVAFVVPALTRELIIGARTMQGWDISVTNTNGPLSFVPTRISPAATRMS